MKASGGVRAGALGIADQVLLSAGNLLAGLALARELEPSAFGVYVIAFAVSLAGASVQLSLVTDPLMVLGAARSGDDRARYLASLLRVQVWVCLAVAAATGLAAMAAGLASAAGLSAALAGVALATVPCHLQTFFRAVFFTRLRTGAVFVNDLIFTLLRLAGLGALMMAGALTPFRAILAGGAAAMVAAIVALPLCRDFLGARGSVRDTWSAHWGYGRWLLATAGAYWCSGQAPTLIASGILSPVAAAVMKACQYLVAPLNVAFNGLDGVLAPRAARVLVERGKPALSRFLGLFTAAAVGAVGLYAVIVLPAAPWIMEVVYKGRYTGYVPIVAVLLLDALLGAACRPSILRLKVLADTRGIFVGYLWSAMTGLSCLILLAPSMGVMGAALAAPISSGTLLLYLTIVGRPGIATAVDGRRRAGSPAVIEP